MDAAILSSGRGRRRPRPAYSCIECTRRKLRCSKDIPCSACVDRGIAQLCRRRPRGGLALGRISPPTSRATPTRQAPYEKEASPVTPWSETSSNNPSFSPQRGQRVVNEQTPREAPPRTEAPNTAQLSGQVTPVMEPRRKIVDSVTEDAAVMLEFLALSRQRVLQIAQIEQPQILRHNSTTVETMDPLFTIEQVRALMIYHQECISWIHNVVHLPTFREQYENMFANPNELQVCWLALYYAMLAVTLYHTDPGVLDGLDIRFPAEMAELCYQKSLDTLHDADFMINHSLFSIQAICLLIYVGHNIGQSDRISVLLASGVRIAQCLCIHRLGSDPGVEVEVTEDSPAAIKQRLIDREVSKRVWWFLVRQDWLQIPFNNTYTIHPTQFNTPMPMNCDEEITEMFSSDCIVEHDQEHYTQGSYTMVLNHVAVLIWRTQDKMCQQGHPNRVEDGLRKLYSEVIQVDRELRDLMDNMPSFFKSTSKASTGLPAHIKHQREVLSLGFAHKFYSVHRHFQIPSFKDPWFAYTKVSCIPIMRRSLTTILSLPEDPYFWIIRNMWTVNTHVLTSTVWLLFELIFSKDDIRPFFDEEEIRELAVKSSRFLQLNQAKSRIAKRGVSLINTLLEKDRSIERGDREQFNLKDIISHVEHTDDDPVADLGELPSNQFNGGSVMDWLSRDAATWENIVDVLGNV